MSYGRCFTHPALTCQEPLCWEAGVPLGSLSPVTNYCRGRSSASLLPRGTNSETYSVLPSSLQNQAERGTSLETSTCSAASPPLSCSLHSLAGFSLPDFLIQSLTRKPLSQVLPGRGYWLPEAAGQATQVLPSSPATKDINIYGTYMTGTLFGKL